MMEVLVTLVVISLALLGTAGLQTFSVKVGQGGQFRTQAVILGLDILERMQANKIGAYNGNYDVQTLPAAAGVNCGSGTSTCGAAALANYDLAEFNAKLLAQLPGAIPLIAKDPAGAATGDPFSYTVTINWVERITKSTNSTTTGGQVNSGGATENFAYKVRRTYIYSTTPP